MIATRTRAATAGLALLAAAGLAGCAGTPDPRALPPIMMTATQLQGATVELPLDRMLSVDTEALATDSYTVGVVDPSIVEFVQGTQGGAESDLTTNPGFTPLREGATEVTMTNAQPGIEPLKFTIQVVAP